MKDLVEIMPQLYLVYNKAGFEQLCEQLDCKHQSLWPPADINDRRSRYSIRQVTSDEEAFSYRELPECDDGGFEIFDADGKPVMKKVRNHRQYPVKYPFLLTFNMDDEFDSYLFFIRYIDPELKLKDIEQPSREELKAQGLSCADGED